MHALLRVVDALLPVVDAPKNSPSNDKQWLVTWHLSSKHKILGNDAYTRTHKCKHAPTRLRTLIEIGHNHTKN